MFSAQNQMPYDVTYSCLGKSKSQMWDPLYHVTFDIQYLENNHKPSEYKCYVSSKAGYLFMNRAAVDEEDQSEILKIFELEKASWKILNYDVERKFKGMIFYQPNDI